MSMLTVQSEINDRGTAETIMQGCSDHFVMDSAGPFMATRLVVALCRFGYDAGLQSATGNLVHSIDQEIRDKSPDSILMIRVTWASSSSKNALSW